VAHDELCSERMRISAEGTGMLKIHYNSIIALKN